MAMGSRKKKERQEQLWIASDTIVQTPGHAFYDRLNQVLSEHGFDRKVEHLCRRYYSGPMGRPSMPPGVYFRALFIGYFEGIDSERGIAWRIADSLSLRKFLGYGLDEGTPDHSTISRTRRLYALSTHKAVFAWVLGLVDKAGLLGKTVAVDGTPLEANAAMRSIVRRDSGEGYEEFVKRLAAAAGLETPTREQLARFDRKRKKKASNDDWKHPHDPDARITKMKDGRTHLAHKVEHTVDLSSGALRAITVHPGDAGDTSTVFESTTAATRCRRRSAPRDRRSRHGQRIPQATTCSSAFMRTKSAATSPSRTAGAEEGKGSTRSRPGCTRTAVAFEAIATASCNESGPSSANAASRTCTRPVACDACISAAERTLRSGC